MFMMLYDAPETVTMTDLRILGSGLPLDYLNSHRIHCYFFNFFYFELIYLAFFPSR